MNRPHLVKITPAGSQSQKDVWINTAHVVGVVSEGPNCTYIYLSHPISFVPRGNPDVFRIQVAEATYNVVKQLYWSDI